MGNVCIKEIYKDPAYTPAQRAEDLLSRMTLEQKIGQLQCVMGGNIKKDYPNGVGQVSMLLRGMSKEEVADISRRLQEEAMAQTPFGIPAIMHIETLSGGVFAGATSYPTAIAQAATWQPELLEKMTNAAHRQMRAVGLHQGFAPVMDISRDPRWGRQGETYGEDPALAAAMSVHFVRGLQSENNVIATSKHFLGYGYSEGGLNACTNDITPRRLREVYAKPFQAAITEAGLKSVMNSYGSIDGEPVITSKKILSDLLRGEMDFKGFVVSDYMSVMHPNRRYKTAEEMTDGGVQALMAGLDNEAPNPEGFKTEGLVNRVKTGKLDPAYIDRACRRILEAKFAIGLFENPFPNPEDIAKYFDAPEYEADSLEMAEKSLVLLKNDGTLPLSKDIRKIAVIGPHVKGVRPLFGCYTWGGMLEMMINMMGGGADTGMAGIGSDDAAAGVADFDNLSATMGVPGQNTYPDSKTNRESPLLDGMIRQQLPGVKSFLEQLQADYPNAEITFAHGYDYIGSDRSGFDAAYEIAKDADVVLVSVGGKYGWGASVTMGEGADATNINLPGVQEEFLAGLAKLGKPYVALHFDGRPVSSNELDRSAAAILECWSPGKHGAEAIVKTLFGDNNPAGRLPVTAARCAAQAPIYYGHENGTSYHHGMDLGLNGYVDESYAPRYYFGQGMSYTAFAYSDLEICNDGEHLTVSVKITNTGKLDGDEVVQLYIADRVASLIRPVIELAGFRRVFIPAGQTKTVTFVCKMSQFAFLDTDMKWKIEAGDMDVLVGASSEDIRLKGAFRIENDSFVNGATRGFYAQTSVE